MLAQKAVDDFFAQDLQNYDWMKEASRQDLLDCIEEMGGYEFKDPQPFLHQLACFIIGVTDLYFLFLLDMGCGKSRIILDIANFLKQQGDFKKGLVLVPNVVNIDNWCDEFDIYTPELTYTPMFGSTKERMETFKETDSDFYIMNYQALYWLFGEKKVPKGKKKPKLVLNTRKVHKFAQMFDFVAYDESTALMTKGSLPSRICRILSKHAEKRFALTGTPFGRDPLQCWGQFYAVDLGETLGPTLGLCRQAYYTQKQGYWKMYEYTFKKNLERDFHNRLKNRSIRYDIDDCVDIPKIRYQPVRLRFTVQQRVQHRHLIRKMQKASNYKQSKSVFTHMRMLSSGFIRFRDEETGESLDTNTVENPKMEALIGILDTLPRDRKMIIIHEYIRTGELIAEMLDALQYSYVKLPSKNAVEDIRKFKFNKKPQILIANWKSGAKGLNLQVANYIVFYETPVSPIERAQCERRIRRPGQKRKCLVYDLIMEGMVDEQIYKYLKEGKDLLKALVDGRVEWKTKKEK